MRFTQIGGEWVLEYCKTDRDKIYTFWGKTKDECLLKFEAWVIEQSKKRVA